MRAMVMFALLTVVMSLSMSACRKDKPELPLATQEGKNTMGCLVNSTVKAYSGVASSTQPSGVHFNYILSGNYVAISGSGKGGDKGNVFLRFYAEPLKADTAYTYLGSPTGLSEYDTGTEYRVNIDDSFNYVKFTRIDDQVAAGTFQFRGFAPTGAAVVVTEGRFDIAREQ